jgi:anthranilate phosphoribosyltransferase
MEETQSYNLLKKVLIGSEPAEELATVFERHRKKGLSQEEFLGYWKAAKEQQIQLLGCQNSLDIVGTGGDGLDTFNISTLSALVCAASGIPVAKHGNRSATSKSGSADILESFGYKINLEKAEAEEKFLKKCFVFLFAPSFNPSFAKVKEVRKAFGYPTFFNLLGPLLNPASSQNLVIGISQKVSNSVANCFELVAQTLSKQNAKNAWLVQSQNGMDEISIHGQTTIRQPKFDQIRNSNDLGLIPKLKEGLEIKPESIFWQTIINPKKYILGGNLSEIQIGNFDQAKQVFENVLENTASESQKNAVILNAAAGIKVAGKAKSFAEATHIARETIESKKLLSFFETLF